LRGAKIEEFDEFVTPEVRRGLSDFELVFWELCSYASSQAPMRNDTTQLQEWLRDFEAAARRPLEQRWRYSFIKTYKPVMDDAKFRAFDTMEEYRRWCEANLPRWLGYARI